MAGSVQGQELGNIKCKLTKEPSAILTHPLPAGVPEILHPVNVGIGIMWTIGREL